MKKNITHNTSLFTSLLTLVLVLCSTLNGQAQCLANSSATFLTCVNSAPPYSIELNGGPFTVDLSNKSLAGFSINLKNHDLTITGTNVTVDGATFFTSNGNAGTLTAYGYTFSNSNGSQYTLTSLNTAMDNPLNNTLQKAVNSAVGILPVTLSSFSGNLQNSSEKVALKWQTATELNNEKFIIETSTEGEVFQRIGEIQGAGTTTEPKSYQFTHQTPSAGANYYRLKQVDFDGTFAYSKVLVVEAPGSQDVFAFPNPVQTQLYVQYDHSKGPGSFYLHDALGRRIAFQLGGYAGNYELSLPADLPTGTYWLKIIKSGKVQTLQVVKR